MGNSMNVAGEQRRGASLAARRASPLARARRIAFRTAGRLHGPIVRLVSPSDLGEVLKPFVFLDHGVIEPTNQPLFGIHPHSGIATLTVLLTGALAYEDTTGRKGELAAGGLEWMKAGNGVWHDGRILPGEAARFFQLWIALPASQENVPAESQYVAPSEVQQDGPVRVLLGEYGRARSPIRAPEGIHYFHVRLKHGQRWRYVPPAHHTVAWLALDEGRVLSAEPIHAGQLAVFEESDSDAIEVQADGETSFVIGSAVKHPHPLVLGTHSVHTSENALVQGEAEIRRIGHQLRAEGRR
jgi:redox-sensitive bicupin YhaK (pirin superfamily)